MSRDFDSTWFRIYDAKGKQLARVHQDGHISYPEVDRESDLHQDIRTLCAARGWMTVHSRMDRKSTTEVGTPDWVIFMQDGRVLVVECKAGKKKCIEAQAARLCWLRKLGFRAIEARCIEDVLEAVEGMAKKND